MGVFRALMRTSLRRRLTLGIGAMLLPLLLFVAVVVGFVRPLVWGAIDDTIRDWPERIQPVEAVETLLLKTVLAVDHYLIFRDPAEAENFTRFSTEVDAAFADLLASSRFGSEERSLLHAAHEEWKQAGELGQSAFALAITENEASAAQAMGGFDDRVNRTVAGLETLLEASHRASAERFGWAHSLRRAGSLFVAAMLCVALSLAIVIGMLLARSILRPLDALKRGAVRIGEGDLAHRVGLNADDEFGDLARTFNAMAEKLERHRATLEDLSMQDELSGVFNYRGFQRRLGEELERSHRYRRVFSLLLLDLDHFKLINDTYGHPVGDEVLRLVAALVNSVARPVDYVARYGGEEFAVLLAETGQAGAVAMAERIRELIGRNPVATAAGQRIEVTASIGLAAYPENASSGTELISAADAALYAAKRAGRNRVCSAGGPQARRTAADQDALHMLSG